MKNKVYFIAFLFLTVAFFSCSKKDDVVSPKTDIQPINVDWAVKQTDNNHIIAIPIAISPKYKGMQLANGDLIGVYYEVNGNKIAAGIAVWNGTDNIAITVWGDDPTTTEKDGLSGNEPLRWVVQIKSENKTYPAVADYQSGPNVYQVNGTSILSKLVVE